jgi:Flp pilus assembly protein TadD
MQSILRPGRAQRGAAAALMAVCGLLFGCAPIGQMFSGPSAYDRYQEQKRQEHEAVQHAIEQKQQITAEEKLALADRMRRNGRVDRAALEYLAAFQKDPASPEAPERLGFLQVTRNPDRAEDIFQSIVESDPSRATAHAGLGLAHYAQGELDEARGALQRSVELAPDDVLALSTLAVVYDLLDQHEEAQGLYEEIQRRTPKDPRVANNMGVSLLLLGDFVEAEAALRRAVDLDPDDPAGWNNLGLALGHQRRYHDAYQAFQKGGDEQAALNNLGYSYYLNGEYHEAIKYYERALLEGGNATPVVIQNLDAAMDAATPK